MSSNKRVRSVEASYMSEEAAKLLFRHGPDDDNKDGYSSTQDQDMPQATDGGDPSSSWKPFKGEGKGGNLGIPIPCLSDASSSAARWGLLKKEKKAPPAPIKNLGIPIPCLSDASSSPSPWGLLEKEKKAPPAPIKCNSKEDVQKMFETKYFEVPDEPFWDGKDLLDIKQGTHLLWKHVPKGQNGGDSVEHEVFHGQCHGWDSTVPWHGSSYVIAS
jgi:hypothetical protein